VETLDIVSPYCGEEFSLQPGIIDGRLDTIEDCMICCQPVHVAAVIQAGQCTELAVNRS
jgi:hypothetical protein